MQTEARDKNKKMRKELILFRFMWKIYAILIFNKDIPVLLISSLREIIESYGEAIKEEVK